jgi:hypothetical protein
MSPEAQRIAIAEACGYSDVRIQEWDSVDIESRSIASGIELQGTLNGERKFVPDYFGDLNAMHEAEKVLNPDQQKQFIEYLIEGETHHEYCTEMLWDSSWLAAHATAAQRAEAFLRTIGKWEGQP